MKLNKPNRERRMYLQFTDSNGIKRPVVVYRDDLKNSKKPPAWMQEILFGDDEFKKGA